MYRVVGRVCVVGGVVCCRSCDRNRTKIQKSVRKYLNELYVCMYAVVVVAGAAAANRWCCRRYCRVN